MTTGIGTEFMRQTCYASMGPSDQQQGLPQPPLQLPYDAAARRIDLPAPESVEVPPLDLRVALERRRTVRRYASQPLTLAELSYLLWCTQGIQAVEDSHATRRLVPSAGARHAFETYLLANRVEGLVPGLYRFLALDHALVEETPGADIADRIYAASLSQQQVRLSAVTLIWTAMVYRMAWRYGERGYRYLHLDAGHVCQNLYLAAEALGCGVCAIAAFDDEALNDALGLDGEEQFAIYLATVGKRA